MAEPQVVPSLLELDWIGDLTLYQHPPCMFLLWYLAMGGKFAYDLISALLNKDGSGSDGGGGGGGEEDGGEKKEEGEKKPEDSPTPPDGAA